MRVLLINSNLKDDLLAAPPLGLCYVAAAAQAAGHEVRVLDLCFARKAWPRKLAEAVSSFSPQVIGVSVRNLDNCNMLQPVSYLPEIKEITAAIRSRSAAPLVLGGAAASLAPAAILNYLGGDYVVVGDGEESFVTLLQALETGTSPEAIPGVGLRRRGEFHLTPPRRPPFPPVIAEPGRWVDFRPYRKMGGSYNLQTKRGCRQQCLYCTYSQLEGSSLRLRPPGEVVAEVEEALDRYHPETFEFVDAVFNDPPEHAGAILEEIARRPWKTHFTAMGLNPRNLDLPFLQLMWRAGFRSLMLTPESAADTMLSSYRKGFTREEVVRTAVALNRTRFTAWWYFLAGGPEETNATLQESLDFVEEYLLAPGGTATHLAHFFLGVRLYPGTKLWEQALREGYLREGADPLPGSWYLSEKLDLARAVEQIMAAALRHPRIFTGWDEQMLAWSRLFAWVFRLLRLPGPYWRYFRGFRPWPLADRRFRFTPGEVTQRLQELLKNQGYRGGLLSQGKK